MDGLQRVSLVNKQIIYEHEGRNYEALDNYLTFSSQYRKQGSSIRPSTGKRGAEQQ